MRPPRCLPAGTDLDRPGGGLHLVLWGRVAPETGALRMTVGVPASVLTSLGVKDLPPQYCLPLELRGTALAQSNLTGETTEVESI